MGSRRRDGLARKQAILDAALECFAERGVLGTGIEDVRRRANASPSSVYHQFGGLEDITLALLVRTFDRLFTHIGQAVVPRRTAKSAVTALVHAHLTWVFEHPREAKFMYQAMSLELDPRITERLAEEKQRQLAPIAQRFETLQQAGSLPAWSPLMFDVVLMGAAHEASRRWLAGAPLSPRWLLRQLPALAWASVQAALAEGTQRAARSARSTIAVR